MNSLDISKPITWPFDPILLASKFVIFPIPQPTSNPCDARAMSRERREGREKIRNYKKNRSLPKEIIETYSRNFWSVGEFAINTNPKAKLCRYLIVNEKIARMIHVALGMGYEPDKKTVYHWDIVVNSPRQKLDIYGIDKRKKIHWIIKKGDFVI